MKNKLLFPSKCKLAGIILFIPFAVLGLFNVYYDYQIPFLRLPTKTFSFGDFDFTDFNLTNEVALSGVITGLLLIAFAREKNDDEFINKIRLESWQWAVLINYGLLFVANWLVYGTQFFHVLIYNMLTVLIIFIIRFHWLLYRYNKQVTE